MSRKSFQQGLSLYREGSYQKALQHFTEALTYDGPNKYLILDSRSSTYLKLGETKEALKDAKKTIEVSPDRWQGYARAARIFFQVKKLNASLTMVDMALARLKEEETQRRDALLSLRSEVEAAQRDLEARRQRFTDHMGKLPIELFSEIAMMVVEENQTSPITLSHVSRHWRDVVHSLPRLWDNLVLTRRRPMQKAKLWTEKSKGRIRELSVRSSVMDVPHWAGDSLDLLKWDHLRILRVQQWSIVSFLHRIGQLDSLVNLEHLETDHPRDLLSFPFRNEDPDQEIGSKLRYLIIVFEKMRVINPLQIRNLTTLILANVALNQDLQSLLEFNPQLENLSLHQVTCRHSPRELKLPNVKTLSLKLFVPSSILAVTLPALEVLHIESLPRHTEMVDFFQSLVDNDANRLTELILRSTPFPHDTLIALLGISQSLQILEVSNVSSLAPHIIEALAATYVPPSKNAAPNTSTLVPTPPMCPHLKNVNFSSCPDVETGPIVRLIRCRLPSDIEDIDHENTPPVWSKITSLVVDYCPRVDSAWLPWLRNNVANVSCVYMKKNTKFRAS